MKNAQVGSKFFCCILDGCPLNGSCALNHVEHMECRTERCTAHLTHLGRTCPWTLTTVTYRLCLLTRGSVTDMSVLHHGGRGNGNRYMGNPVFLVETKFRHKIKMLWKKKTSFQHGHKVAIWPACHNLIWKLQISHHLASAKDDHWYCLHITFCSSSCVVVLLEDDSLVGEPPFDMLSTFGISEIH